MNKVFGLVNSDGVIENTFYWDKEASDYPVKNGYSVICIDGIENCGIGWLYINGEFIDPYSDDAQAEIIIEQPIVDGAQSL